ncbi:MAG: hypothetical protein GY832_39415 [Chloroflexi bacterium]|nr:hypothetical protein [Chloroflexota bacterium]
MKDGDFTSRFAGQLGVLAEKNIRSSDQPKWKRRKVLWFAVVGAGKNRGMTRSVTTSGGGIAVDG